MDEASKIAIALASEKAPSLLPEELKKLIADDVTRIAEQEYRMALCEADSRIRRKTANLISSVVVRTMEKFTIEHGADKKSITITVQLPHMENR